jgi:hypothetical protein
MEDQSMDNVAWLIEDTNRSFGPRWLRIIRHSPFSTEVHWSEYASLALRFCRKEDAENFWFLCPQPGIIPTITEHKWVDGVAHSGEVK